MDQEVAVHTFVFNGNDNSGEQLSLTTRFIDNGDLRDNIYLNQELTLQSYCNSVTIFLAGVSVTPDALRQLANEMERELIRYQR